MIIFLLRGEIKEYLPPQEEFKRSFEEIYTFCMGQIASRHSLDPQEAKIKFIGAWYFPHHIPDVGDGDGNSAIFICNFQSF